MNKEQKEQAKKIFQMVYQWGRANVVVDETAPAFEEAIEELLNMSDEDTMKGFLESTYSQYASK